MRQRNRKKQLTCRPPGRAHARFTTGRQTTPRATPARAHFSTVAAIVGAWWQFVVNLDVGAVLRWLEVTATEPGNLQLTGSAWSKQGALLARYRSRSARFDDAERTLYYSWEGEHPREQTIPHFFGVGEITFRDVLGGSASSGDGWFSSSSSSDVKDSLTKSTTYVRPTVDESSIMTGTDRDKRAALIQAKLMERQNLNV